MLAQQNPCDDKAKAKCRQPERAEIPRQYFLHLGAQFVVGQIGAPRLHDFNDAPDKAYKPNDCEGRADVDKRFHERPFWFGREVAQSGSGGKEKRLAMVALGASKRP